MEATRNQLRVKQSLFIRQQFAELVKIVPPVFGPVGIALFAQQLAAEEYLELDKCTET